MNNSACEEPGFPQLVADDREVDGQLPEVREALKMVFDRGHANVQTWAEKAECACQCPLGGKDRNPVDETKAFRVESAQEVNTGTPGYWREHGQGKGGSHDSPRILF